MGNRFVQGLWQRVCAEGAHEAIGQNATDIAAVARKARAIEAALDDDRIVHITPPRRGTWRVHAENASLLVRQGDLHTTGYSSRLMR